MRIAAPSSASGDGRQYVDGVVGRDRKREATIGLVESHGLELCAVDVELMGVTEAALLIEERRLEGREVRNQAIDTLPESVAFGVNALREVHKTIKGTRELEVHDHSIISSGLCDG